MKTFEDIILHKDESILKALDQLNLLRNISSLILFIVNDERKVIGSLTDGDIRRFILETPDLSEKIELVCNKNFVFEYQTSSFLDLKKYRNNNILILPILNKKHQLVDLIDLESTKAVLPVECMIMAGGRGKRLSPLTDNKPKPMLPLGGKPIIEHNIDRLVSYGVKKIYISLRYLGEQIVDYLGNGESKGIEIEYIWENEPLGTAGALALVDKFNSEKILLMNSDLFTNVNLEDLYLKAIEYDADMAIASTEYKIDVPYAVFETKNLSVQSFVEKPTYIYHSNAGIYLFKKELINYIPPNRFFDITDLMNELIKNNKKIIHNPIAGYWIDIGKPLDYQQAQEFLKHIEA